MSPFFLNLDDIKFVPRAFHEQLHKSALWPGDVAVVRTDYPGTACVIPQSLPESNCADLVIITPSQELNPYYLAAVFNSAWGRAKVAGNLVGVAQQHFNITVARELEVPLLPRAEQDRVAAVLSAYDEFIDNNQRRVRILEKMARSLYREWFVDFRFPGQERIKRLVNSTLGQIPQGWRVATLNDATTKIGSGATPRGGKEAYQDSGLSLIRSLNIYDCEFEFSNLAFIDDAQANQLNNVIVEPRDVLLNITGASVARCSMVPSYILPARVNQHVAIVRADPRSMDPYYLLDTINSEQNKQKLLGLAQGGATREALTKETISNFPILLPPRELILRYGEIAGPVHVQRETLTRQTQNLRQTRDLLLPRLLSGQVGLKTD